MRDRDTIDSELRRLAAARRSIREHGGELSSRQVDDLLDERLGHRVEAFETRTVEAPEPEVVAGTQSPCDGHSPYRRRGALTRFGLLTALPLSLVAVAAAVVLAFTLRNPHPAIQPAPVRPASPQTDSPPADGRTDPIAPGKHAAMADIVDKAFIDVLQHEGVPIPSREYAMNHAHAVCDFVADQPSFTEAVRFVQRSSTWDADQSTKFAAGAIASYCPQFRPVGNLDQMQQTFQDVLSGLQAIEGDLQDIEDHVRAIPGRQ